MRPAGSGPEPFTFDPGGPPAAPVGVRSRRTWLRRLYMTLRTEHRTPGKVGTGVAVGVFVGCSPLWGFHFPVAYLMAKLFRLNRMLVYAAAYIGNPLTAGPILFSEVQLGHLLLYGSWLPITLAEVESLGFWGIFTDLIFGSVVFGLVLGAILGSAAWLIARAGSHHETYHEIVEAVVVRFVDVSIRDAEAVRSRLLKDPMYPFLIGETVLGAGLRVLDLGCGRGAVGVLLGLFTRADEPRWYLGVDRCDRYVRAARQALEDFPGCAVGTLDLRDFDPPSADIVVLNDVLRSLPFAAQDALLRRLARALPPGARLFVRERDAAGGWRFAWSAFVDASKILVPGHPREGTHYRRAGDLRNALIAAGFSVRDPASARASSPAWVMVEAVRRPAAVGPA
jgi:uncharacterized protein (DUF2062 family)/2-polyprenyl-3-methyl-5-hydroxy-6-metoxy-1,4-benzoquinol methylase